MNDFQNHCNLIPFVWTALLLKSSKRLNNQNTIYVKFEYFVERLTITVIIIERKNGTPVNNKRLPWSGSYIHFKHDMIIFYI